MLMRLWLRMNFDSVAGNGLQQIELVGRHELQQARYCCELIKSWKACL